MIVEFAVGQRHRMGVFQDLFGIGQGHLHIPNFAQGRPIFIALDFESCHTCLHGSYGHDIFRWFPCGFIFRWFPCCFVFPRQRFRMFEDRKRRRIGHRIRNRNLCYGLLNRTSNRGLLLVKDRPLQAFAPAYHQPGKPKTRQSQPRSNQPHKTGGPAYGKATKGPTPRKRQGPTGVKQKGECHRNDRSTKESIKGALY